MSTATLYSQPGCAPCFVMEKALAKYGIAVTKRDVREDDAAYAELVEFYETLTDGRHPATPVVVIDDADGAGSREILLGPALDDLKAMIRDGKVVA